MLLSCFGVFKIMAEKNAAICHMDPSILARRDEEARYEIWCWGFAKLHKKKACQSESEKREITVQNLMEGLLPWDNRLNNSAARLQQ